jgi:hypothetical protein
VRAANVPLQQTVVMPPRAAPGRLTLGHAGRGLKMPKRVLPSMRRHYRPSGVFGVLDRFLAPAFLLGNCQTCHEAEREANGAKNCCDFPHRPIIALW